MSSSRPPAGPLRLRHNVPFLVFGAGLGLTVAAAASSDFGAWFWAGVLLFIAGLALAWGRAAGRLFRS